MPSMSDLQLETLPCPEPDFLDAVKLQSLSLLKSVGVVRSDRMSEKKYHAGRFELLATLAYPHADFEQVTLCNDFNLFLFFVDDQAEEDEAFGKHPAHLHAYFERLSRIFDGAEAEPDDPAGQLLTSIRERLSARMSPAWLARFGADLRSYLIGGTLEAARNWTDEVIPPIEDYLRLRTLDSAMMCSQDLFEMAGAGELPSHLLEAPDLSESRQLCTNVVALSNDLFSYAKEVRHYGSPNNLVRVIMVHERRSLDDAVSRVIERVNADIARWEQVSRSLIALADTEATRHSLLRYLAGQRAWMHGAKTWSVLSGRYADPDAIFPELRPPLFRAVG